MQGGWPATNHKDNKGEEDREGDGEEAAAGEPQQSLSKVTCKTNLVDLSYFILTTTLQRKVSLREAGVICPRSQRVQKAGAK